MAVKHTHKLRRHTYKKTGNSVFFCTLPDCHFKIDAALALGKKSLCNLCDNEFIMNEYQVKLVKPHCCDCGKIKVMGDDGKSRYVRKDSLPVMAALANETTTDLRNRLDGALALADKEEDI